MNRFGKLSAIGVFSLLVLVLPLAASAQYGRVDDDSYRNGRGGGYGGYGDIRGTVQALKDKARGLETRSDRVDDRRDDRYNGRYGNRFNNLEGLTDRFRNAAGDLAGAYGRGRNLNNSADEARRVLDLGSQIDRELSLAGGMRRFESQWNNIRYDLQVIARTYNMRYDGGRRGNWRDRLPF